jgi:peptidoglycan/LPS O-acetylase OafA/YrhL
LSSGVRSAWRRLRSAQRRSGAAFDRLVDRRLSVALGSALIVVGIGQTTGPLHTRIEFYTVVAQLMPVLMLVAAVNGRYFREREAPPFDRFLIRGFWVVGLLGIGAALVVVARGHDSVILRGLVIYALALIGVLVTVYAIHGPAEAGQADSSAGDPAEELPEGDDPT